MQLLFLPFDVALAFGGFVARVPVLMGSQVTDCSEDRRGDEDGNAKAFPPFPHGGAGITQGALAPDPRDEELAGDVVEVSFVPPLFPDEPRLVGEFRERAFADRLRNLLRGLEPFEEVGFEDDVARAGAAMGALSASGRGLTVGSATGMSG